MRTLVWFRGKDLRVADHEPLRVAAKAGEVVPLFVLDTHFFAPAKAAAWPHRMQTLLDALAELRQSLRACGTDLRLVDGRSVDVLPRLVNAWKIDRVVAHRWSEPFAKVRDERIAAALSAQSVPFDLFGGETLLLPDAVRTKSGGPFAVYTPYARAFMELVDRQSGVIGTPIAAPTSLPPMPTLPAVAGERADVPTPGELGITRNAQLLPGGEAAARARLAAFCKAGGEYATTRDRMDLAGTSRLSADLKFGTVSVRAVWHKAERNVAPAAWRVFRSQLIWREFAHHLMATRPELLHSPFRAWFNTFPWRGGAVEVAGNGAVDVAPGGGGAHIAAPLADAKADADWRAWCTGHTGYPIVDAAARQLLGEGYVHNRARMITASFLTKHLLIDYRRGEAHFAAYLADGDWALNNMGWQWSAGCGVDAQPYFRVFNPVNQGERFDPTGEYVRRWVPELRALPTRYVHAPWLAPPLELAAAGVRLGETYPLPIVDHAFARERFLSVAKQTSSEFRDDKDA